MNNLEGVKIVVEDIYRQNGCVRPSELVEAARPEDSPAHDAFEWDDSVAGDEYRLWQARSLIRKVTIIVDVLEERFIHVPSVCVATEGREGLYKPLSVLAKSADEFKLAIECALSRLQIAEDAYNELKAVADKNKKKINTKKADKGFSMIHSSLQAHA